MIRISITAAAYAAIANAMPLGSVGVDPEPGARASVTYGLSRGSSTGPRAMRGPGESYSDVILRLASDGGWS